MEEQKGSPRQISRRTFLREAAIKGGGVAAGLAGISFGSLLPGGAGVARVEAGGGDEEAARNHIWEQVIEPSQYAVHALRAVDGMPDINLEKIRMVGLVFWPKDVIPKKDEDVRQSIQEILAETGEFWEGALDNQTSIASEVLPFAFVGQKSRSEYGSGTDVIPELEEQLKSQLQDQQLLKKYLDLLERARTGQMLDDNPEFTNLVLFVLGPDFKDRYHSGANFGVTYVYSDVDSIINWKAMRTDNLVAHEAGHGLSLPDQYFTGTDNDKWWYDPDPKNIMGQNMWDFDLSEGHLAYTVKQWMLNQKD